MLFKDWAEEWETVYLEPTVSPETYYSYCNVIKNHILPALGNLQLKNIKSIHIQKMLNDMTDKAPSKKMLSRAGNLTYRILKEAKRNNLIIENPAEDITVPKGTAETHRAVTDYERQHILNVCEHHRAGTWIYLMLYAGLRPAEACALQWRHVDFEKRFIRVEQSVKRSGVIGEPKTKAGKRNVPLSDKLYERLKPLKGEPFDFVVANTQGNVTKANSMKKMWQSFVRELNIDMGCKTHGRTVIPPYRVADDLVPYCLRHTFCTDLQDAGVPINVAKELMGHTDIATTAKIYTHGTERTFSAALDAMNNLQKTINT
jgi:integrase